MDRDIQFEVQFLLSTIVVVLGVIGMSNSARYISDDIGIVFIIIVSVHLLLLITYYAFNQLSNPRSPYLDDLKNYSENTLFLVSSSFVYLISHIIVQSLLDPLSQFVLNNSSSALVRLVANYLTLLLPLIPTLGMVAIFWTIGLPIFRLSRNLSINIVPEQTKVYSNYSDQRTPLMLEIKNGGSKEYELTISMELPDKVVAKNVRENKEFVNSEFSKKITIEGNSRKDIQLVFRHDRSRQETAIVRFEASHSRGVLEESVSLYLR